MALLLLSGIVYGGAQGLLLSSLFWHMTRLAPAGLIGSQVGIRNFLSGLLALAGGLGVGFAFDSGRPAALGAVLGLALLGAIAAMACARWLARFGGGPRIHTAEPPRQIRKQYPSGAAAR